MNITTRFSPINCILPPHMLEEIIKNGDVEQKERAREMLEVGTLYRQQRQVGIFQFASSQIAPAATTAKTRLIYDGNHGTSLPGTLVRAEGDPPTNDEAVDEAYDGLGATYDLFKNVYGRNSIDDNGMVLKSTVHYGMSYDNAFWNGEQMVFGDGDEVPQAGHRVFHRFTIDIAIIAHELTHGVTEYEARLIYKNQSGALNEHFSDVFGSLVKQQVNGETANQADWIIGEGLFSSIINGVGIRSMKAPGTAYDDPLIGSDPQPDHMDDYVNTTSDNGGVHINSGIPNKAFYLAATAIGGFAWEKAGMIWYITLKDKLRANSDFMEAARMTIATAGQLYGFNSSEREAVKNAWDAVGLTVSDEGDDGGGCFQVIRRAMRI